MKIPVWLKPGLWGAALGAITLAIVGFSQLGWKSATSAEQFAQERADTAVVAALVPFCVAKAEATSEQTELAKLRAEQSSYSRSDLVTKAGWATLGDAKSPDSALARACSAALYTTKAS
jgi:hypothetical protein